MSQPGDEKQPEDRYCGCGRSCSGKLICDERDHYVCAGCSAANRCRRCERFQDAVDEWLLTPRSER